MPAGVCRSLGIITLALVMALGAARPGQAHPLQVEPVIVTIHPQKTFLSALFTGNIQDITVGEKVTDAERRGDGFTRPAELRVEKDVNDNLKLKVGGVLLHGTLTSFSYQSQMDPTRSRFTLSMRYPRPAAASKDEKLTITSTLFNYLPNSKTIISIGGVQKTLAQGEATTIDPSALAVNLLHNLYDFMMLGIMHIFTGPDHMLFILGLLMVSPTLKILIKTLTGFTIAHSITLALSALNVVVIDNRVCDIFIALSIVYIGVENFFAVGVKHRFWIATAFGLVHGFGFSASLREVGLPQQGLGLCLLSFNGGVEIAQVIICCIAFPLLMLFKKDVHRRAQYGGMHWGSVVKLASMWVVFMGGYWLVQRAFV